MKDFLKLGGKRIIVTGASSGIGRETAIQLSKYGAKVIAIGRDEDKLEDVMRNLSGDGHKKISFDLTEFEQYPAVFSEAAEDGLLDGLVHCAGISKPVPIKMLSETLVKEIFDVNFVSFMEMVKLFCKEEYSGGGYYCGGFLYKFPCAWKVPEYLRGIKRCVGGCSKNIGV